MLLKYKSDQTYPRYVLLFNYALGVKVKEAHRQPQQVEVHDAPSQKNCMHWTERFALGDHSLENKELSGRPIEVDLKLLQKLIEESPYQTTCEWSKAFSYYYFTVHRELIALGKVQRICRRQPPDLDAVEQRRRMEPTELLLTLFSKKDWLKILVTGDKKWYLYANYMRERQ